MPFYTSKSAVDSLKSVFNVFKRKLLLGAPVKKNNDPLLTKCKTLGLRHLSVVQGIYKVESIGTNISFSALGLFSFMLWYSGNLG